MKIDFERLDRMAAAGAPAAAIIEALRVDFERDEARKVVKRPKDATRIRDKRKATRGDIAATSSDIQRHAATSDDWPEDFGDQFWNDYPRKTEKLATMKKLATIRKSGIVAFAELMAGVQRYAKAMVGAEPQFIKGPAAWLNAGRWSDEAAALVRSTGPPRGAQGFESLFQQPETPHEPAADQEYDLDLTAN